MNLLSIFSTTDDLTITLLRVVLGIIMFPHGAQKVLGWLGGDGIKGTFHHMRAVGVPDIISWLTIIGQFLRNASSIVLNLGVTKSISLLIFWLVILA